MPRLRVLRAREAGGCTRLAKGKSNRVKGRLLALSSASQAGEGESLYEVLGVHEDASAADIKQAYRSQARKVHPDVSDAPNAAERFKRLSVAYQTLRDANKRAEYDRHRQRRAQQSGRSSRGRRRASAGSATSSGRTSVFEEANRAAEEDQGDFYGLADFLRDCERDWENARAPYSAGASDLWSDLAALGEQFVDFLEESSPPLEANEAGKEDANSFAKEYSARGSNTKQTSGSDDVEEELQALKAKIRGQQQS